MTKAYLIAVFDVSSGTPVLRRTEIKSAPAGQLTQLVNDMDVFMDVTYEWGGDYDEAAERLKWSLEAGLPKYRWAFEHLQEPSYRKGDVVG